MNPLELLHEQCGKQNNISRSGNWKYVYKKLQNTIWNASADYVKPAKDWKRNVLNWYSDRHPGGRLNKKDGLTRYGDSHVKDKTS